MPAFRSAPFIAMALLLGMSPLAVAQTDRPPVTVFSTPWCGCCGEWADAVAKAGYQVKTITQEDLTPVRRQAGVPADMLGCHVAAVEGYFLEGHVPLEAISKLLAEKPALAGIAVPGMPRGSLGMGSDPAATYDVIAVPRERSSAPFVFFRAGG